MIAEMQNPFAAEASQLHAMRERFLRENPTGANAVTAIADAVTSRGGQAYIVGGFVRDALLGSLSHDLDLEIYGVEGEDLKTILEELFPSRVNVVGSAFGILHVALPDGVSLDVALPRRESKQGKGHRGFVIEGDPNMSVIEAARRRDFTVNAMLLDITTWEVVDPFQGQTDLDTRVLRVVDSATFQDDPLRVYRAIQLAARLESTIEEQSFALMKQMVERGDLAELSKERITDELKKLLLRAEKPSKGLEIANELKMIERDMPELENGWSKMLSTLDAAAELLIESQTTFSNDQSLIVMLAALCSQLEKTDAKTLVARWTFSKSIIDAAINVASSCRDVPQDETGLRKLVRGLSPTPWQVFVIVAEAITKKSQKKISALLQDLESRGELLPLLEGRDLLIIGMTPGPRIGELLRAVEDARDEGKIKTREQAFAFVRKNL